MEGEGWGDEIKITVSRFKKVKVKIIGVDEKK